jgi:hypothetical protein
MACNHLCQLKIYPYSQDFSTLLHCCRHNTLAPIQRFKHQAFDNAEAQIRLLRVWRTIDDELHAHLHHFRYNEAPPYVALSYMWGKGTKQKIIIDGSLAWVLPNLYSFLHVFAGKNLMVKTAQGFRSRYPMWLWTDQLCIDQSSESEKAVQVAMMAEIYPKATLVIVWLGMKDVHCEALRAARIVFNWNAKDGTERLSYTKAQQDALYHLIHNNKYWERVWVVQEMKLARSVILWCGIEELLPQELLYAFDMEFGKAADAYLAEFLLERKPVSLARVYQDVEDRSCEKPHDRVYGVQSLLDPNERLLVDYRKPIAQVFLELAQVLIKKYALRPVVTEDSSISDGVLRILWHLGATMGVFQADTPINSNFGFDLLVLYPERLEWQSLQTEIAKWLPGQSRFVIPELGRMLRNIDGRSETINDLRKSAVEFPGWWSAVHF